MTNLLQVREARKAFGATKALDGLSLELREGELLGLLGPNGAGKTTLVRAIAGRVRLDGGSIELFGKPVGADGGREELGVVPQEIAIYPLLTARENLTAFGELQGLRGARLRERVEWALEWTNLGDRAHEPIRNFSGGMKRRLNIACGVLHGPRVVLLDEPTVGVDPQSRERIHEMLGGLRREGTSLLLTTHHLEEAEVHCERIVIVDHGRVCASGTLPALVSATVGPARTVVLTLDRAPGAPLDGFTAGDDPRVWSGPVADLDTALPSLLARVRAAGLTVADLEVRRPSLQSVFIHLTGRELRE